MFVYSEKATKFCKISTLILSIVHTDKSKVEILQNFVAFLEYINFNILQIFPNYSTFCVLHLILFGCHMTTVKWFRQFFDMFGTFCWPIGSYHQVANMIMSHLIVPISIFRLNIKGKFAVYLLWPLVFVEKVIFSIVAGSTVCDSTVHQTCVVFQSSE